MSFEAELAAILKTNEKNVVARARGLKILPACGRCGGCGSYSFNMIDGSRCYGCNGSGQVLPKSAASKKAVLEAARDSLTNGTFDAYMFYLAAVRRTKKATDVVMAAWTATGISDAYDWRKAAEYVRLGNPEFKRDKEISEINKKMAIAYDAVSSAAMAVPSSMKPNYQEKVMLLDKTLAESLEAIAAAKIEFDNYMKGE